MFILFWDAKTKTVKAMNGSGRAGHKYALDHVRSRLGLADGDAAGIPKDSPYSVTVPGAAAGWVDTVDRFGSGKVDLARILKPAIELGEKGFPVSEHVGYSVRLPVLSLSLTTSQTTITTKTQLHISICKRKAMLTDNNSGWAQRNKSAMHPPTLPRCSNTTPHHPTRCAPLARVKS